MSALYFPYKVNGGHPWPSELTELCVPYSVFPLNVSRIFSEDHLDQGIVLSAVFTLLGLNIFTNSDLFLTASFS